MQNADWSVKLWWSVPAAVFLVLIGLAMLFGKAPEQREHGTSYDASGRGFRAAYLLLEELGYPVTRAKRLGGRDVRWVLFPTKGAKEVEHLDAWVREGGIVLLADTSAEFARSLGIELKIHKSDQEAGELAASGLGVSRLALGGTGIDWTGQKGEVIVEAGDKPVVTVYKRGQGEVWLVNSPEILSNRLLARADNAVLVCRLATEMLQERPGRIAFDEYFHGMRDRPGVVELLFQPPALWVTLHGLGLLGVLLWHFMPRFGSVCPLPTPTRRSKEEFLEAMAYLLERKGDYAAALEAVRNHFARELEQELGLRTGISVEELVAAAAASRPVNRQRLLRLLTLPHSATSGSQAALGGGAREKEAFVKALNEIEAARAEILHG